jgi:hypothetical protein
MSKNEGPNAVAGNGFVILTLSYHKEQHNWVGECLETGTSTYGRVFKKVHDELIELIELHVNELEAVGERTRFFNENGIKLYTDDAPTEIQQTVQVDSEKLIEAHRVSVGASA